MALNTQVLTQEMTHGFAGSYARQPEMIVSTRKVGTWYDNALSIVKIASLVLTVCCGLAYIATTVLKKKKEA